MNIRQRVLSARILDRMEKMHRDGSEKVVKDAKGYKYIAENGEVLIEAEMKMRSK